MSAAVVAEGAPRRDVAPVTNDDIRALVDASLDMLCLLDEGGTPVFVSSASTPLTGYDPDELVGRSGLLLVFPADRAGAQCSLGRLLAGESVRHTYRIVRKDGGVVWVESLGRPSAREGRFVIVTRDVTPQVRREADLRIEALHDPLTGLANRQRAVEEIAAAVARAERLDRHLALVFIDIDDFKSVNDVHGHPHGDEVLRTIGHRLRAAVRRGDLVARIGGDEFIVVMEDLPSPPDVAAEAACAKVRRVLGRPHTVEGTTVYALGSVGYALWQEGQDPSQLMRAADRMMYRAKRAAAAQGRSAAHR